MNHQSFISILPLHFKHPHKALNVFINNFERCRSLSPLSNQCPDMTGGLSFFAQAKLADAPPEPGEVAATETGLLHVHDGELLHALEDLDHQLSLSFVKETAFGLIFEVAKIK